MDLALLSSSKETFLQSVCQFWLQILGFVKENPIEIVKYFKDQYPRDFSEIYVGMNTQTFWSHYNVIFCVLLIKL